MEKEPYQSDWSWRENEKELADFKEKISGSHFIHKAAVNAADNSHFKVGEIIDNFGEDQWERNVPYLRILEVSKDGLSALCEDCFEK